MNSGSLDLASSSQSSGFRGAGVTRMILPQLEQQRTLLASPSTFLHVTSGFLLVTTHIDHLEFFNAQASNTTQDLIYTYPTFCVMWLLFIYFFSFLHFFWKWLRSLECRQLPTPALKASPSRTTCQSSNHLKLASWKYFSRLHCHQISILWSTFGMWWSCKCRSNMQELCEAVVSIRTNVFGECFQQLVEFLRLKGDPTKFFQGVPNKVANGCKVVNLR